VRLICCIAVFLVIACTPSSFVPLPSSVGDEQFSIMTRTGPELSDAEYEAFYASTVKTLDRVRDDVIVSVALGNKGSTISEFAVHGSSGADFQMPFIAANLDSIPPFVEAIVSGKQVLTSHGSASTFAVCAKGDAIFVAEAIELGQLSAIVAQLPC
jgi:hypothetical protein